MPQTMLSVAALIIFSLFAVSQQRRLVISEQVMIRNTIATMANGVAVQTIDEAAANDFDESTRGGTVITSSSELTLKADFGGENESLEDIDDYSRIDVHPDSLLLDEVRVISGVDLVFERTAEVNYVKKVGSNWVVPANTGERTKYKQIEVTVYAKDIAIADTVRIKQVVSCGANCQF